MTNPTTTYSIQHWPMRWLVWGLCALVACATVYAIGDILVNYAEESSTLRTLAYLLDTLFPVLCAVIAALIVSRKPGNAIGWLLFGPALAALVDVIGIVTVQKLTEPPPDPSPLFRLAMWLDSVNWLLSAFPILLILVLFPTGRPPSRRWNWVVALALGMVAFELLLMTFAQYWESPITTAYWRIANPIGFIPDEVLDVVMGVPWLIALGVLIASSMAALVWRYRRSSFVERAQIRWPLFASAVYGVVYVALESLDQIGAADDVIDLANLLLNLASLAIPLAIGLAILRYRLWDIDVIIRRTLIYGALSLILAVLFFAGVTALQAVLGGLLPDDSQAVTAFTTLGIAILALPLRNRIQAAVDRRFYRQKYDAQKTLEVFASPLQSQGETDVDGLAGEVMGVIHETLQPGSVKVWLITEGPPLTPPAE